MGKTISMQELNAKAQELGTVGDALQWAKANGYEVDPQNGFAVLPPEEGEELPPVGQEAAPSPFAVAAPAEDEETDQTDDTVTGPLSDPNNLRDAIANFPKQQEEAYRRIFEQGQEYFSKIHAGPTRSQQLFALSKALLSPTPYRGFAGVMSNLTGALGDIEDARAAAMRKRAEAEQQLRQTLATAQSGDAFKALQLRYNMQRVDQAAAAAAEKAKRPTYQLNPLTGKPTELPKFVHKPVTKAEYDAIPYGEYYVVPAGPSAGQIVPKLTK